MSSQNYIRSVTDIIPDDFPTLTPLPEVPTSSSSATATSFLNITWQTWIIIILILALLGINIFAYLAKGTQDITIIFKQIFGPILKFFGYSALTTAKQTIETTATGAKTGIDVVADTSINTIDTIQETAQQNSVPPGQMAPTSYPVQQKIQQSGGNTDKWQQDSLAKALESSKLTADQVQPDDSRSSIQTTGKSGWCYIGDDQGVRSCSDIGINDTCMSGDVFPSQEICMNPNLRA